MAGARARTGAIWGVIWQALVLGLGVATVGALYVLNQRLAQEETMTSASAGDIASLLADMAPEDIPSAALPSGSVGVGAPMAKAPGVLELGGQGAG